MIIYPKDMPSISNNYETYTLPDTNDDNIIILDVEVGNNRFQLIKEIYNNYRDEKYNIVYINTDCKEKDNVEIECLCYPFIVWDYGENIRNGQPLLDYNDKFIGEEIKYNFISLNCAPKSHRLLLITDLKDYEYFEYSFFPFPHTRDLPDFVTKTEKGQPQFNFGPDMLPLSEVLWERLHKRVIAPRILTEHSKMEALTFDYLNREQELLHKEKWFLNNTCPLEYYQSNIDIVTESYITEGIHFSEKTLKPLFIKKPFLILGDQYQHAALKKLGFELFEEIFDYEFDSQPNFEIRYEMMMEQILQYINEEPKKLSQIIIGLKDKLEHNYEMCIKYMQERNELLFSYPENKILSFLRNKQNDYTLI